MNFKLVICKDKKLNTFLFFSDKIMEALNVVIDSVKEMFGMETEQTSKFTDAGIQVELEMDNTRIFNYILVKQVNKKNANNKGILKLDTLKSLNASNETKRLLEQQDNHDNHVKTALPMPKKNAINILVDLQKKNSDLMFEMIYNDKKKIAYYFKLKTLNYTPKELIDGNTRYPHSYYSFETY